MTTLCTNFKRNRPTFISKSAPVSQAEALKHHTLSVLCRAVNKSSSGPSRSTFLVLSQSNVVRPIIKELPLQVNHKGNYRLVLRILGLLPIGILPYLHRDLQRGLEFPWGNPLENGLCNRRWVNFAIIWSSSEVSYSRNEPWTIPIQQ